MGLLGGVAAFEGGFEFEQILRERRGGSSSAVSRRFLVKKIGVAH
jgi:hypothetical protein